MKRVDHESEAQAPREPTTSGMSLRVDRDPPRPYVTHLLCCGERNISETNARMQPRYWVGVVAGPPIMQKERSEVQLTARIKGFLG